MHFNAAKSITRKDIVLSCSNNAGSVVAGYRFES